MLYALIPYVYINLEYRKRKEKKKSSYCSLSRSRVVYMNSNEQQVMGERARFEMGE
jgi:hypothetical protein